MSSREVSSWLPQVVIESVLIVVSILVALGLDEWRENRENAEFVQVALSNFLIEITRNKSRIEDAAPFNRGLRQVLNQHYLQEDVTSVDQFVNMIESYSPATLQSTAWDTALATGSLAKMQYNLVTALSLTYSLQNRYTQKTNTGIRDLTSPLALASDNLRLAIFNSVRYLDDTISTEAELSATYSEALIVVNDALINSGLQLSTGSAIGAPKDLAHP